jgi:hypothetical protein
VGGGVPFLKGPVEGGIRGGSGDTTDVWRKRHKQGRSLSTGERRPADSGPNPVGARVGSMPQHGAGEGLGHRRVGPRHSAGRWLKPVQVYSNEFEFKFNTRSNFL